MRVLFVVSRCARIIAVLAGIVAGGTLWGQAQATDSQLNVATFNITPDERFVSDCSIAAGSDQLSCPDGAFSHHDNSRIATVFAGPAGVLSLQYVSGGTITGGANGWCYATVIDGGGTGAVGYFRTISNGIAAGALYVPLRLGTGYITAPTTVMLGNSYVDPNGISYPASPHGDSCSGTAAVNAATFFFAPITTTMKHVDAKTVRLGTNAINTLNGTAAASFGTDWTSAVQSAINRLAAQGGGTLYFPPTQGNGRYLILSGLTTPDSGGLQAPIRITGGGGHWDATYLNGSTNLLQYPGGTNIDMRASSGLGKIQCLNSGSLEVDRISWEDWGFDQTPFFFYGLCHPYVHDNTFFGSGPGDYVSQNNAVNLGDMAGDYFQGYSAVIDMNYFARIAEAMFAGEKGNGPVFTNNTIAGSSGGTFAVLYNGTPDSTGQGGAALGYRAGNLYELVNYAYGIGFINAVGNEGFGEQFWDSHELGIYTFYLSGKSTGNACWGCGTPGNNGWTYYDATGKNPMTGFGDTGGGPANIGTLGGLDSLYLGDSTHLASGLIKDTSATPVWEMLIPGVGDQKLSLVNNGSGSSHLAFTNAQRSAVPYTFDGAISATGNFEATAGGFKMDTCSNPAYVLTAGGSCTSLTGVANSVQVAQAYAPTILNVTTTQNNLINFTPTSCANGVCQFRLCAFIKVLTAGTGGTFQWTFNYIDDGQQLSNTSVTIAVNANIQHQATTGVTNISGCQNFDADPGVAVTAKLSASGITGAPTVRVSATLEQLQ